MLYAIVALLVLIADQALKYYVTLNIPLNEGVITLIPGVMSLVNYHNTGAAFSMLSGGGARWAFVVLAAAFTIGVSYAIINRRIKDKFLRWTLLLIAAGAMGNAIDRALYGYVVDMFRTDFMNFAIFNVADIFITLGCIALCIAILRMPGDADAAGYDSEQKEKKPGFKLFSDKKALPDDVAERRRTGKLYGEKKPVNTADPFGEFAAMPTVLTEPKAEPTAEEVIEAIRAEEAAERLAAQLENEMTIESILDEYSDGID